MGAHATGRILRPVLVGLGAAVAVVSPVLATSSFATMRAAVRARPLAVSVPADAAMLRPGATTTLPLRVVNAGSGAIRVTLSGRAIEFGDNGRVTMSARSDPRWAGRVSFPTRPLDLPPQTSTLVTLTVHAPPALAPDLYFIGFVVTPVASGGARLRYVNQIASYLTVDVPGPRVRKLTAHLAASGLSFSAIARGRLTVENVGRTAAVFWGEQDTSASPGTASPAQQRFDRSLLPAGRVRSISISARSAWPIGFVTMRVRLSYPARTDAATTEIDLSKRVLVIEPIPLAVAGVLMIAMLAGAWTWRRRVRGRRRTARPSAAGRRGQPRLARAGR